jgi:hypothetical protein
MGRESGETPTEVMNMQGLENTGQFGLDEEDWRDTMELPRQFKVRTQQLVPVVHLPKPSPLLPRHWPWFFVFGVAVGLIPCLLVALS